MKLLTKKQQKSYKNAKICYICKENLKMNMRKKNTVKLEITVIIQRIIEVRRINGSSFDYHFIIKELAEKFKKQFTCLGENTYRFITFTVPAEKRVTRIDKTWIENYKKYILYITIY